MKTKLIIILMMLVVCLNASVIDVPGDYTTIQEAIDNAVSGDTVLVSNGTWEENIIIDKPLMLKSQNGCDSSNIEAENQYEHVIRISSNNVTIVGFSVYGAHKPLDYKS